MADEAGDDDVEDVERFCGERHSSISRDSEEGKHTFQRATNSVLFDTSLKLDEVSVKFHSWFFNLRTIRPFLHPNCKNENEKV